MKVIKGPRSGRYPYSNSLLIGKSCLIDSGAGEAIRNLNVEWILNTHWHEDHIALNKIGKKVAAHFLDADAIESYEEFKRRYGLGDAVEIFINFEFRKVDEVFDDGDQFEFDNVKVEVVHTPGHSAGHCCFIVDDATIFLGDIDLTSFGPWYGCLDCDVGRFVKSIDRVKKVVESLEIKEAIPSHGESVRGTENIIRRLDEYRNKIFERDRKIRSLLLQGEDPVGKGIFYKRIPEPREVFLHFEKIMVEKHLTTLQCEFSPP